MMNRRETTLPIDSSIPLQVQPVRMPDQMGMLAKLLNLQAGQQQIRLGDLKAEMLQRSMAEEANTTAAMQQHAAGKLSIPELGTISPKAMMLVMKAEREEARARAEIDLARAREEEARARKEEALMRTGAQKAQRAANMFGAVKDQASYELAAAALAQEFGPTVAEQIPPVYDPAWVAQKQQEGMQMSERLQQQLREREFTAKRNDEKFDRGIRLGQLGVAEGNLDVARRNAATSAGNLTLSRQQAAIDAAKGNVKDEATLRDDFTKAAGDFVKTRDAHERVLASARDPSAAGDLALIFNYMKVLDPASVVRESEFATAAASGAYGDRIAGAVNRVINGERLADNIRKDFVDRSGRLYEAAKQNHRTLENTYTDIAKRSGARPENVVIPVTSAAASLAELEAEKARRARGAK